VWAIGLRNPWRWSFDGGDLWIADVGQDEVEEIDLVRDATETAGVNFGWPVWEGDRCVAGACTEAGFTMPVATYRHEAGCAVSGGAVYRGEELPELRGAFFYGDFCSGRIWSVTPDGEVHEWTSRTGAVPGLTAIAAAADGGILLTTMDGRVLRLRRG